MIHISRNQRMPRVSRIQIQIRVQKKTGQIGGRLVVARKMPRIRIRELPRPRARDKLSKIQRSPYATEYKGHALILSI